MSISILKRYDTNCGICSNLYTAMLTVYKEFLKGNISIIDFSSIQYSQFHDINHQSINVWEDYFEQPFGLDMKYASKAKQLVNIDVVLDYKTLKDYELKVMSNLILKPSTALRIKIEYISRLIQINNTLGVLVRGTDYIRMKPKKHPIVPDINTIINGILKIKKTFPNITTILLATDEKQFIQQIQNRTNLNVICIQQIFLEQQNTFNYDIMKTMSYEDKKEINLSYLAEILMIAHLKYVLLSNTSAADVYNIIRQKYVDIKEFEYIYNLGVY